jgi:hypothetical protein
VVLDRLGPQALTRALLGPRPRSRRRRGGMPSASVRGYRARRAAGQAKTLARSRRANLDWLARRKGHYIVPTCSDTSVASAPVGTCAS